MARVENVTYVWVSKTANGIFVTLCVCFAFAKV